MATSLKAITSDGGFVTGGNISAVGNITGGNLSTTGAEGNISGANFVSANTFNASDVINSVGTITGGNLTTGGVLTVNGTTDSSFAGNVNMNGKWLNNIGYAVNNTDAASKQYVDTLASTGISYHQPVNVATTTTLATSTGGTTAYNSPNGAANGIGAYISTTGVFLNIDSSNVQTVGTRILVKDEANATWNGVYTYSNTTAITRATDADEYGPDSTEQISINDYFFVQAGTVNVGKAFVISAPTGTITFGTSDITFATFSTSQVYTGGTGITIAGTVISANTSQTQVTAVGVLTSLSVSGNSNIGNIGTGGLVTATGNITGANIITSGAVRASTFVSNIATGTAPFIVASTTQVTNLNAATAGTAGSATTAGTVTTASQPNITSLGTLSSVSVSGNSNVGNLNTARVVATGNISGTQIISNIATGTAPFVVTSTTQVANLNVATAGVAGTVTTNSQPNITSVGTLTSLIVTGNITGGNLVTGGVITSTGNITGGNLVTGGVITSTGNITGGNIVTSGLITSTGNITGANLFTAGNVTASRLISNIATGTAPFTVTSTTQVANLNVATAGVAGTVTTQAQPNITSTGTLASLSVSGTSNLGAVGNVTITGGTNGYVLSTNGSGGLSWIAGGSSASISNGTSNVSIATSGGNVTTSVAGTSNVVVVSGTGANITGTLSVSGNVRTGSILTVNNESNAWANANAIQIGTASFYNLSTGAVTIVGQNHYWDGVRPRYIQTGAAGSFQIQGNLFTWSSAVSGTANSSAEFAPKMTLDGGTSGGANLSVTGNVITSGVVTATGNITGSDIITNGVVTATGNITGGNIITSGAGGNITGANVITANTFSASGNFIGNTNGFTIGYLNVPQVAASNTTLALSDAGKHYYSTLSGSYTLTIPANNSVAFDTGTQISIVVQSGGNILVNAASGVSLYLSGDSTPGNRTVGSYCWATLLKVAANTWFIDGTGVF